jgi:hypothetical protein
MISDNNTTNNTPFEYVEKTKYDELKVKYDELKTIFDELKIKDDKRNGLLQILGEVVYEIEHL